MSLPLRLFIAPLLLVTSLVISVICHEQDFNQSSNEINQSPVNRLLILSLADETSVDKLQRLNRSIEAFSLDVEYFHVNQSSEEPLRLHNFEALRTALELHRRDKDLVVLVSMSLNLIMNGDRGEVVNRFNKLTNDSAARLIFSADYYCFPKPELAEYYPKIEKVFGKRFLNSRAMIGFSSDIYQLFELVASGAKARGATEIDLQAELTGIYLNETLRKNLGLGLDHRSELFQSLDAKKPYADDEVELEFERNRTWVKNLAQNTRPLVIHAGGRARVALNSLGNYLGNAWTLARGCAYCDRGKISLKGIRDDDLPRVLVGIFIEEATPFMENFYESLRLLEYPKRRMHLFIHNKLHYHSKGVREFLEEYGKLYASFELLDSSSKDSIKLDEAEARNYALEKCRKVNCDYYLSLDSTARLDRPQTLGELIETNRTVVAPLLSRPTKLWSNCWASISEEGYYRRSHDYVDLVSRERKGVWNVPLVMECYLIEGKFLRSSLELEEQLRTQAEGQTEASNKSTSLDVQSGPKLFGGTKLVKLNYKDEKYPQVKAALIFSRNLRQSGPVETMQYVTNEEEFGHLVDVSKYNLTRTHPDFYELETNMIDWQQAYMNDKYFDLFDERDEEEGHPDRIRLESPCQDVYWFPLVNDRFCDHLIEIMETFGQWSGGKNDDPRIEGGYESVPTRDIHFRQVGLHQMWLYFMRQFVMPIQMKEYVGYEHDPPRADLAFVVRYNPTEQASLRPHHDSSTYTINIALNTPGKDYEGGGCRFVRYNCSVTESRRGWALIHPGRLTHYHEGLPVTKGTRYIMVTFVDP